jgi:hypothetical protein
MTQYTELTANTRRGARGLLVPPKVAVGSAHEDTLLPATVAEIMTLDLLDQDDRVPSEQHPRQARRAVTHRGRGPCLAPGAAPRIGTVHVAVALLAWFLGWPPPSDVEANRRLAS